MLEIDRFSRSLLEESKRFLEKADESGANSSARAAYLHASLMLGFCAFEAHINAVADDFLVRPELTTLERSILGEQDFKLENGEFVVTERLKMYRLDERFEFLYKRFSGRSVDRNSLWWERVKTAMGHRNQLVHPKGFTSITDAIVRSALQGIVDAINELYLAVYGRPFPAKRKGLNSSLNF
jgi:hypothetical protein